jgi:hypothetical protein
MQIAHEQVVQPVKRGPFLRLAKVRLAGVAIPVIPGIRQGFRVPKFPPVAQGMEWFRAYSHICFTVVGSIAATPAFALLQAKLQLPKGNIKRANARGPACR